MRRNQTPENGHLLRSTSERVSVLRSAAGGAGSRPGSGDSRRVRPRVVSVGAFRGVLALGEQGWVVDNDSEVRLLEALRGERGAKSRNWELRYVAAWHTKGLELNTVSVLCAVAAGGGTHRSDTRGGITIMTPEGRFSVRLSGFATDVRPLVSNMGQHDAGAAVIPDGGTDQSFMTGPSAAGKNGYVLTKLEFGVTNFTRRDEISVSVWTDSNGSPGKNLAQRRLRGRGTPLPC